MVVGEIENQSTSRRLMGSLSASSQKGQDKEGKVMGGSGPTGKDRGDPRSRDKAMWKLREAEVMRQLSCFSSFLNRKLVICREWQGRGPGAPDGSELLL